jgi:NarL family two-component system response regulator LiaR
MPPFVSWKRQSIESSEGFAYAVGVARIVLLYGVAAGVLVAVLDFARYRFLVVEHSLEIYGGVVALLFAGLGIRLGLTLTRTKEVVVVKEVPVPVGGAPFVRDATRMETLGLTPRELEILEHIAAGKSTREIASALFVSENTVKTHTSRVFEKLGARRRTQAVQEGRRLRLIE